MSTQSTQAVPFFYCPSAESFSAQVLSSKGDKTYLVSMGEESYYGWECTCPDFRNRHRECKHIRKVKAAYCGWNQAVTPEIAHEVGPTGKPRCPKCHQPALQGLKK